MIFLKVLLKQLKKEYNLNLSQKRALAIKDILIEMGIKKENLRVLGKGLTNRYYLELVV